MNTDSAGDGAGLDGKVMDGVDHTQSQGHQQHTFDTQRDNEGLQVVLPSTETSPNRLVSAGHSRAARVSPRRPASARPVMQRSSANDQQQPRHSHQLRRAGRTGRTGIGMKTHAIEFQICAS